MTKDKEIEMLYQLVYAMVEYITVLGKELDDVYPFLNVHGIKSNRVQEGIDARNKIMSIKEKLEI